MKVRVSRITPLTIANILMTLLTVSTVCYFLSRSISCGSEQQFRMEQERQKQQQEQEKAALFEQKVQKYVQQLDGIDVLFFSCNNKQKKQLFENVMLSIKSPSRTKLRFAMPHENQTLSLAIIEPRESEFLRAALYNMAHEASLFIFHGTKNAEFVANVTNGWLNVQLVNLGVPELKWPSGPNDILISKEFYKYFKSEFVLTFQTDSLIRRQIDQDFFQYDYVGGPWHEHIIKYKEVDPDRHIIEERRVGNGGFALRRVSAMIELAQMPKATHWQTPWEDQWIAINLREGGSPPLEDAKRFAADSMFHPDPVGIHKIYGWYTISFDQCVRMLVNIPGATLLTIDPEDMEN